MNEESNSIFVWNVNAGFLLAVLLTSCASLQQEAQYCGTDTTVTAINAPAESRTLLGLAKAYQPKPREPSHKAINLIEGPVHSWNSNLASAWFHASNSGLLLCRYPVDSDRDKRIAECENVYYEFTKENGEWAITKAYSPVCVY